MSEINRYHKTFIGTMEQCNDGEWVKFDDFYSATESLQQKIYDIEDANYADNKRIKSQLEYVENENKKLKSKLFFADIFNIVSALLIGLAVVYFIGVVAR